MSAKLPSILIGGLVYAVLGLIGGFLASAGGGMQYAGGAIGCLAVLIGAAVAVWHYTSTNALTLSAGQGAGLGAMAGAVGSIVSWAGQLGLVAAGIMPDPVDTARAQLVAQGMTPEQIDQAMGMAEMFSNPLIGLVVGLAIGALLGAIGGAIGAAIFKKGAAGDTI